MTSKPPPLPKSPDSTITQELSERPSTPKPTLSPPPVVQPPPKKKPITAMFPLPLTEANLAFHNSQLSNEDIYFASPSGLSSWTHGRISDWIDDQPKPRKERLELQELYMRLEFERRGTRPGEKKDYIWWSGNGHEAMREMERRKNVGKSEEEIREEEERKGRTLRIPGYGG